MTAQGQIKDIFSLSRRGIVLVLEEGFSGAIPWDGVVESDLGSASYSGVNFADNIAEGKAWVTVTVDFAAGALFARGSNVRFYRH